MHTKLSLFATKISEGGWLAALVIVPLLFNVYTERVFEEDKIPLMRSIALVIMVGLIVWLIERGREVMRVRDQPLWKVPLVIPALVLTGAYIVSTIFSLVPQISFWGAYIRRQGTYTWLSYVVIFFGILLLVRERKQVERIITVILLTSVPTALYGFIQNQGMDPLPWGGDVITRVSSTAGNPIFIAAYLIMVWPLTLARVIEHFKGLVRTPEEGEPEQDALSSSLLAGGYLFLLVIQTLTILFSQSRGPQIGLGAGIIFFGILYALRSSRWLTLSFTGLGVAGILFLAVFNLPNSPLAPLREVPYIGRLGQLLEVDGGTGRVRTLIWEGATSLLAANPSRDIVGYGPEAMYVAYNRYYPPELGQIEQRNASPDRSHNETFDSLVMTGVVGFVAQIALFLSIFYYALRWLGFVNSPGQRNAFLTLALVGGGIGGILPYLVEGSFRFAGVGLPAGIAIGLIVYLMTYALTHLDDVGRQPRPHALWLIALLSAIMAHFVEIHFGIAIGATRLYFWVFAALVVVVGMPLLVDERLDESGTVPADTAGGAGAARRTRREQRRRALDLDRRPILTGTLLGLSIMTALVLIVMSFNFYTPSIDLSAEGFALVWLFVGTWLFGALVVSAEATFEQEAASAAGESRQRWLKRVGVYTAVSLGAWFVFSLIYVPWVNWRPNVNGSITIQQLQSLAGHIANTVSVIYVWTFLIVLLAALAFLRDERLPRIWIRPPQWQGALYGGLLIALVPLITMTNLNISRADVFNKQGTQYEGQGQWDAARVLYEEALRLQPREDRYFLNMGRALMERGRAATDAAEREEYFEQALAVLQRAQTTNPLNTDHTRNLASLSRVWSTMVEDPAERERLLNEADQYYARAVELSPNNAALWNDWGALHAERGQFEQAMEKLDHSLEIDDRWVNTYLLRGSVQIDMEQYDAALAEYEQAIALSPRSVSALSGKAFVLTQMEQLDEAIAVTQQAIEAAPSDYNSHKNLALLYQQTGQLENALQAAQTALTVAGPENEAAMQGFIQQLMSEISAGTPDG